MDLPIKLDVRTVSTFLAAVIVNAVATLFSHAFPLVPDRVKQT